MSSGRSGKPISIEQLIAFNDEIIGLIRAGVPLELGLKEHSREMPAGISRISLRLATRLSRGESLSAILASPEEHFPAVYCSIVEAGQRAGKLSAALEEVSRYARNLLDLRRKIGLALLYPAIVVCMAYGIFLVFLSEVVERFRDTYEVFRLPVHGALRFLLEMQASISSWWAVFPICVLALATWWMLSGTARTLQQTGSANPLTWIPSFRRLTRNFHWANFADLLALLIEQQVPLPEGIVLAADATGGAELKSAARLVAQDISQGGSGATTDLPDPSFPPYLRWLIFQRNSQIDLVPAVRQAARTYRMRALSQVEWLNLGFPVLVGVVVGGGATLLYALLMLLPFIGLLEDLTIEPYSLF